MIQILGDVIKLRQATKQGYIEIPLQREREQFVADLTYPKSKTRRGRIEDNGNTSPTITAAGGLSVLDNYKILRTDKNGEITEEEVQVTTVEPTLEQQQIINRMRIRKLTPEECFTLMGMTEEDCIKARNVGVSNSQLYKQAGNGLISNVVQYLMEHVYKTTKDPSYVTTDERMVHHGYGV